MLTKPTSEYEAFEVGVVGLSVFWVFLLQKFGFIP